MVKITSATLIGVSEARLKLTKGGWNLDSSEISRSFISHLIKLATFFFFFFEEMHFPTFRVGGHVGHFSFP